VDADGLVPPDGLGVQAIEAKGKGKEDEPHEICLGPSVFLCDLCLPAGYLTCLTALTLYTRHTGQARAAGLDIEEHPLTVA